MTKNFTVLELGDGYSSGYCGRLLAGTGAHVVKVEEQSGSPLREAPGDTPFSAPFEYLAMYKQSITPKLDQYGLPDSEILNSADIIIEEFDGNLNNELKRLSEIQKKNSHAIIVVCSPFGLTGPYKNFCSSDLINWAMSGYAFITGKPNRTPLQGGGPWCSYVAGTTAAVGALSAARANRFSKQSEIVDVSVFEAMAALHQWSFVLYTHQGVVKQRSGNYHAESHHPLGLLACKDGWVAIAVSLAQQWENFCLAIEQPELLIDPKFRSGGLRFDNANELNKLITPWLNERTQDEIVSHLQKWSVPASPVLSIEETLKEPQLKHRNFWIERKDLKKNIYSPSLPVKMQTTPNSPAVAPKLGEHNAQIKSLVSAKQKTGKKPVINDLPLAGMRVLELSIAWAGPLTGRFLADLGADVIRIEHRNSRGIGIPPGGFTELVTGKESTQDWKWGELAPPDIRSGIYPDADPGERPWNRQGTLNKMHRNKRSLCIDLKTEEGKKIFRELTKQSDIVLNNYRPRAMERLGLDYKNLKVINEKIICMTMSGYGATGPLRDHASFGPILEAHSGFAMMTGYGDGIPMKLGAAFPDGVAGLVGAYALLDALHEREVSGQGQNIDLSQLETYLSIAGEKILSSSFTQKAPTATGNRSEIFAPQGFYPCKGNDNWVALTIKNEQSWSKFIDLINNSELKNTALVNLNERQKQHDLIDKAISLWTSTKDKFEVMQKLQKIGIPAGVVMKNSDMVNNAHLRERKFIVPINQTDVGIREFPGFPIHFNNIQNIEFRTAPNLGAHNQEIIEELLGFDSETYRTLVDKQIIATEPELSLQNKNG
ncbi:MAG: CoA transferase [Dehalococcoidia bacterium]|nr:CoA transferase [Dehalococcoidia bacterium]